MTEFTDKELEKYYRKEPRATEDAILSFLRDSRNHKMIVFGGKAVNAYLPAWLDKETKDWDILTPGSSKKAASDLEARLNKHYGGEYFSIEPAIHEGTFRIRSKVTGVVVADISMKDRQIDFKKRQGVNYATLDFLEEEAENVLSDPEKSFRHNKDRDTLQRIKVLKRVKDKQKRKRRAGDSILDSVIGGVRY